MPRSLVVGNGRVLVGFDPDYELRDIFYPHVGRWNHTLGNRCRTGFFVDGKLAWVGDEGWQRDLGYVEDALVTHVKLTNEELGIRVTCHDYVDMARDLLVRSMEIHALRKAAAVRVFFHYDWYIQESDLGCCALFDPRHSAVIAYKNDFYFLAGGAVGREHGLSSWAIGKKGGELQGTWVDAEDGELARGPIDQGSVDCTVMLDAHDLEAGHERRVVHWLCCGRRSRDVTRYGQHMLVERGEHLYRTRTETYWQRWADKDARPIAAELGEDVQRLYRRSQVMVRSHCDGDGGVIAATDFDITKFARDTYSYVWPRDAALAVNALDRAGHADVTRRFFEFAERTRTGEGFFLHKYTPAGDPGSSWHPWIDQAGNRILPIQEDETGLVLWALWEHFHIHRNLDFAVKLYTSLVVPAATWMMDYADQNHGLPKPSWDLWEERWGVHAFTVGAVWAGLEAARRFAELFGDAQFASKLTTYAHILKQSTDRHLYRPELGRFARRVTLGPDGVTPDPVVDSALYGLWRFGMYEPDEPRIVQTMNAVRDRLRVRSECDGVARYENDYYFQVERDVDRVAGNPWFICTLWLAQWMLKTARDEQSLAKAAETMHWVVAHQIPGGLLSEQLDPHTGAPLSVSPLTWSHAEFIVTVDDYLRRAEELKKA